MAKYSIEFKKRVVKYFYRHGITATISKFDLPTTSTIQKWVRKYETVGFMRKKSKTLSAIEKMGILEFFWKNGYAATEIKHDVNSGSVHKWERKYREYGIKGLTQDRRGKPKSLTKPKNVNKDKDLLAENQRLRLELEYLKKLDALVQEREERERKKK